MNRGYKSKLIQSIEKYGDKSKLMCYDSEMDVKNNESEEVRLIISKLGLEPLPVEGGYFKSSYLSEYSSAIYYLITSSSFSALHRLSSDEIWHFYGGDPAEQLQLFPDGSGRVFILGGDIGSGELPQLVTPAGVWQGTRLAHGGRWALFGTTMAPAYSEQEYEHGDSGFLCRAYPEFSDRIKKLLS